MLLRNTCEALRFVTFILIRKDPTDSRRLEGRRPKITELLGITTIIISSRLTPYRGERVSSSDR